MIMRQLFQRIILSQKHVVTTLSVIKEPENLRKRFDRKIPHRNNCTWCSNKLQTGHKHKSHKNWIANVEEQKIIN